MPKTQKNQKNDFSEYDEIELTPEEELEAIRYKKMLKAVAMEREEKTERDRRRVAKAREPFTFDELKAVVLDRAKQLPFDFVLDSTNERVFNLLCLYFIGDSQFNSEFFEYSDGSKMQMSLEKGIALISSKKGTGKTVMMSLFQQNKYRPYFQIETKNVSSSFQKKGEEAIEIHSEPLHIPPHPDFFYYDYIGICFDDLGFELPKSYWGSKSDVMSDVIFAIYRKNQMKGNFSNFHFTSNLSGNDIQSRYDDRIRDRMREMFNVIVLSGESRRK